MSEIQGDELKTYGDVLYSKAKGKLSVTGFNTNSIEVDEIKSTFQDSIVQQFDIQCYQEKCWYTKKAPD